MSSDFDAYHKWLGIRAEDQPPNHYRLIGVELFEEDAEVISHASDARMTHLRTFRNGPRGPLSQRILNEVAAARVTLLSPERKRQYDEQLRASMASAVQPEPAAVAPAWEETLAAPLPAVATPKRAPVRRPVKKRGLSPTVIGAIAVPVIAVLGFILWQVSAGAKNEPAPQVARNVPADTPLQPPAHPPASQPSPERPRTSPERPRTQGGLPRRSSTPTTGDLPRVPASEPTTVMANGPNASPESIAEMPETGVADTAASERLSMEPDADGWINLLAWNQGFDWAPRGIDWNGELESFDPRKGLVLKKATWTRYPLPAIIEGDYELEVEFTRHEGTGSVSVYFPVATHVMHLDLGSGQNGDVSGIHWIDGKDPFTGNSTTVTGMSLENGRRYRAVVTVKLDGDRAAFTVTLDDKPDFIRWEGKTTSLTAGYAEWHALMRRVWLGSFDSRTTFHVANMRSTDGSIRREEPIEEQRANDRRNGLVRLVNEPRLAQAVGYSMLVANQGPPPHPPALWPIVSQDPRFCDDYYGAHATSRLKCSIPARAKSFTVFGSNITSKATSFLVYIDGELVYESGVSPFAAIKLNLPEKRSELELVVDDLGDYGNDYSYWLCPRFHNAPVARLADKILYEPMRTPNFELTSASVGYAVLTRNEPLRGVPCGPLHPESTVPCDEFIFAHAPSSATYAIPEGMRRFTAVAYIVSSYSTKYEVWVDGNRIYESPQAGIVPIDVPLPPRGGTLELKIDPMGDNERDGSFWCYPRLHKK